MNLGHWDYITGERLATDVLAIGSPVATAPYVDTRLGADPIAVLPIASRSPVMRCPSPDGVR